MSCVSPMRTGLSGFGKSLLRFNQDLVRAVHREDMPRRSTRQAGGVVADHVPTRAPARAGASGATGQGLGDPAMRLLERLRLGKFNFRDGLESRAAVEIRIGISDVAKVQYGRPLLKFQSGDRSCWTAPARVVRIADGIDRVGMREQP